MIRVDLQKSVSDPPYHRGCHPVLAIIFHKAVVKEELIEKVIMEDDRYNKLGKFYLRKTKYHDKIDMFWQ